MSAPILSHAEVTTRLNLRKAKLRDEIAAALANGKTVIERPTSVYPSRWRLDCPATERTFIPECWNATFIAAHIAARVVGFGWDYAVEPQ